MRTHSLLKTEMGHTIERDGYGMTAHVPQKSENASGQPNTAQTTQQSATEARVTEDLNAILSGRAHPQPM